MDRKLELDGYRDYLTAAILCAQDFVRSDVVYKHYKTNIGPDYIDNVFYRGFAGLRSLNMTQDQQVEQYQSAIEQATYYVAREYGKDGLYQFDPRKISELSEQYDLIPGARQIAELAIQSLDQNIANL